LRLVVDTNILFSFFWKKSFLKKLMLSQDLGLFSPEFALLEIKKYEGEIRRKTGLSKEEFNSKRADLTMSVAFVSLDEYSKFFKKLKSVPDKDDIDFFALALKLKCPLWSNEKILKAQSILKVFSTADLLKELEKLE